jgi:hypothetical protein
LFDFERNFAFFTIIILLFFLQDVLNWFEIDGENSHPFWIFIDKKKADWNERQLLQQEQRELKDPTGKIHGFK